MTYPPGTKLSYNNGYECCTVLTHEAVHVSIVEGKPVRERMWLADWLILADGQECIANNASYKPGTKLAYNDGKERCTVLTNGNSLVTMIWGERAWQQMPLADWLILANGKETVYSEPVEAQIAQTAQTAQTAQPTYPTHRIQTKLTWMHEDSKRIAIVTKHGILQVKYVCPDGAFYTKILFENEEAWRNSLPNYGAITYTTYPLKRSNGKCQS
jgi:hypothetical protein